MNNQFHDLINNNMIYVICFAIIAIICFYFLLVWQIREIVKDEIKAISAAKNKKRKQLMLRQQKFAQTQRARHEARQQEISNQHDMISQHDIDSYIDPAEGYNPNDNNDNNDDYGDDENEDIPSGYGRERLHKNNALARDITDNIR